MILSGTKKINSEVYIRYHSKVISNFFINPYPPSLTSWNFNRISYRFLDDLKKKIIYMLYYSTRTSKQLSRTSDPISSADMNTSTVCAPKDNPAA